MNAWEFLIQERKIRPETLEAFAVENRDGDAWFPWGSGYKVRYHKDDERKFRAEGAARMEMFGSHLLGDTAFIVEGESDAMRLWQELHDDSPDREHSVVGIGGVNGWFSDFSERFRNKTQVYVVLDNESDYQVEKRVEACWLQIRSDLGPKAHRIRLPNDVKDLCEFFDKYDLEVLRMLAERKDGVYHYKALDLTQPPTPPDWLIDEIVCKGDVTLCIGEPGVRKSWLAMALSVAIANGSTGFLGRNLDTTTGRVLYVDEENPEPLVPWRMSLLGLHKAAAKNIRYLHRQGVRLDRNPELLLDECFTFEPDLIILDSLTRLHTKDENNAGEVARLFNDAIVPLSRETGATTLILHHVNKGESTNSFTRARGSGDLSASIDTGLDIRSMGGNVVSITQYKSRHVSAGSWIKAELVNHPDGRVSFDERSPGVF